MSVALPELPDDRRAQHPQHGDGDVPPGWVHPGAAGPPEPPARLPSTPWPVGGVAAAPAEANGYARPQNGYPDDRPAATNGRDIARFAVPDGRTSALAAGPNTWTGFSPANAYRVEPGRRPGPPLPVGLQPSDGHPLPPVEPGRQASGHPVPPAEPDAQQTGRVAPGTQLPGTPAGTGPQHSGRHPLPSTEPSDTQFSGPAPRVEPGTQQFGRADARVGQFGGPVPSGGPGAQRSGRHPAEPDTPPSASPALPVGPPARRIHSDVPPPRRTGPADVPEPQAWAAVDAGPDESVDLPTVPGGLATAGAEPTDVAAPPRRRRRAVGSPDERPASDYRDRAAAGGRKSRGGKRRRSTFWKELPILVVVALLLTFLIQTFVAKVYVIPSGSMETTLHGCTGCQNDRVLVDKITYRFSDPKPGDVVVFRGPDGWTSEFTPEAAPNVVVRALQDLGSLIGLAPPDEKDFIKRVIAVGGQTVQCCDSRNRVLVNGKPLNERYIYFLPEAGTARQDAFGPVTVPAGTLWMMGDSRNNSADSRVPGHGPVPISNVIGRARFIVLPFARIGVIPSPNPQTSAAALGSGDAGAPAALAVIGLLPLAVLRRRERERGEFLPRRLP